MRYNRSNDDSNRKVVQATREPDRIPSKSGNGRTATGGRLDIYELRTNTVSQLSKQIEKALIEGYHMVFTIMY